MMASDAWMKKLFAVGLLFFLWSAALAQEGVNKALVSLKAADSSLREILAVISQQTGLQFVYHDKLIDDCRLSISMDHRPFDTALQDILSHFDLSYEILPFQITAIYRETGRISPANIFHENVMKPPMLVEDNVPHYPLRAQEMGLEGRVGVYILVSRDGTVTNARIASSSGSSLLDEAALESVRRYRFKPARQGNSAVDIWISWTLDFKLQKGDQLPISYVQKIRSLRKKAEGLTAVDRGPVEWEILKTHDEYARYYYHNGNAHDNKITQLLVSPSICREWEEWWDIFPLQFLVFDDFIKKHSESGYVSFAASRLNNYINFLIKKLNQESRENPAKKELNIRFIDKMRAFLKNDYNQTVVDSLIRG